MKLRELKHRLEGFSDRLRAWPPIWVPGGHGPREAVLRAHLGHTITNIGDLDV